MNEIIKYLNNMNENGWINYSDYSNLIDMAQELQAENSQIDEYRCVIDDVCRQYKELEAENEQLRARLQNAIELPCKVGDTVYWLFGKMIYEYKVKGFTFNTDDRFGLRLILGEIEPSVMYYKDIKLFFDRAKAEAKLKEIGGEQK